MMKFCTACGHKLVKKVPPGDSLERFVCASCQQVHYQNPRVITGCIAHWQGKILLCRRAIEPHTGSWTLPAGYMENDETMEQGALREAREETGANISLDTLDPVRYRELTRGGSIQKVLNGIDASLESGLTPVKINCVLTPETTPGEIEDLREFCGARELKLRFIRQMDLQRGKFWKVEGGQGGHCTACNRMRLTVDGRFIPCLFSEKEYSISEHGIQGAFEKAMEHKPWKGKANTRSTFYRIGG